MLHHEARGSVALIQMEHGKVNAMDLELLNDLRQTLKDVEGSPARAMVLTGTGKSFSAGVDLLRLLNSGPSYVKDFVPVLVSALEDLFLFSKPVVALVNGHAIAGGCILACACDFRIATEGSIRIGVPELLVGVPFPPTALEIMRFASPQHIQEIVYSGKYYNLKEALDRNLIDEIVNPEKGIERSVQVAQELGSIPAATFRITKRQLRMQAIGNIRESHYTFDEIQQAWSDPKTHEVVRAYLEKTIGRRS
jgi:enoyl-CoA hydratase